jgi:hypothetical protein
VRLVLPFAFLLVAGCDVDSDPAQEKVTVTYDRERIEKSAADAGRTAKEVATGVANVAKDTGKAIKKEVGDFDVDVKVTRERPQETAEPR